MHQLEATPDETVSQIHRVKFKGHRDQPVDNLEEGWLKIRSFPAQMKMSQMEGF